MASTTPLVLASGRTIHLPAIKVQVGAVSDFDQSWLLPTENVELIVCVPSPFQDKKMVYNHMLSIFRCSNVRRVLLSDNAYNALEGEFGYSNQQVNYMLYIITKHLNGDQDMLLCQDELIDVGFAGVARL